MKASETIAPARLFIGIFYPDEDTLEKLKIILSSEFGEIDVESDSYDFTEFTDYYCPEMGNDIKKRFIVFKGNFNRENIADVKLKTNEIEDTYTITNNDGKNNRKINLDPGYFTRHQLVLPSAKEKSYRVYLKKGIFAHLTLMFTKDKCISFHHTFPDFKSKLVQDFFLKECQKLPYDVISKH